MISFSKF